MQEIWKGVIGFEALYEVSTLGNLRSKERQAKGKNGCYRKLRARPIARHVCKDGRVTVQLWKNNRPHTMFLHRLVLEAFVGPRPPGMEGCHFPDRTPANCKLKNLRWDTPKNNMADQIVHGTRACGSKKPNAKFKESDIPKIIDRHAKGETVAALAREYGVLWWTIGDIIKGHSWKHAQPNHP